MRLTHSIRTLIYAPHLQNSPFRRVLCSFTQSYYFGFLYFDWLIAVSHNFPGVMTVLAPT